MILICNSVLINILFTVQFKRRVQVRVACLKVDYGTIGQLFSHLRVFNDVQAPGKAIPGADHLSFSDSAMKKLDQFAKKINVKLTPTTANQLCGYLAETALNLRHISEQFSDTARITLANGTQERTVFYDIPKA